MPTTVFYHGEQIGPRPLVILDQSVSFSENPATMMTACLEASKKYEPMLSSLAWEYGAVYIPLPVSFGEVNVMEQSCVQVSAVLDALDVRWTHFLVHSYGALVGARMAASAAFPHRIGSLLLLDTPLITESLVENMKQREEIRKAEKDVNVPPTDLAFAIEHLRSQLETPLLHTAAGDQKLYEDYLFNPNEILHREGLEREEDRYVPVHHLAQIHHPIQLLAPSKDPIADVSIHKEFFGLRRPALIKSAMHHDDLFSSKSADEVAEVTRTWMNRFEQDFIIKRRFEQSAKEMAQLMSSATPAEKEEPSGEKKKEKKKKGR